MGQGPPALAISITTNGIRDFIAEGILGEDFPIETSNGAIDLTASATGGDSSYAYLWSVTETGDSSNIANGNLQLSVVGTQNVANYNTSKIKAFDTGINAGDPPIEATYVYSCTVTDGTGATATAIRNLACVIVAQA